MWFESEIFSRFWEYSLLLRISFILKSGLFLCSDFCPDFWNVDNPSCSCIAYCTCVHMSCHCVHRALPSLKRCTREGACRSQGGKKRKKKNNNKSKVIIEHLFRWVSSCFERDFSFNTVSLSPGRHVGNA